jgi:hypothetical protein
MGDSLYNRPPDDRNELIGFRVASVANSLLVYTLAGTGKLVSASINKALTFSGYYLIDQNSQSSSFIWFGGTTSSKTYTLEKHTDIDVQSTGSGIGATSLFSFASTNGSFPNVEKEIIWLSGAKALVTLGTTNITAPRIMTGIMNNLTIQGGTVIESQNSTLTLDGTNTLTALTNNETLDAAIIRLTKNLKRQGYSPTP